MAATPNMPVPEHPKSVLHPPLPPVLPPTPYCVVPLFARYMDDGPCLVSKDMFFYVNDTKHPLMNNGTSFTQDDSFVLRIYLPWKDIVTESKKFYHSLRHRDAVSLYLRDYLYYLIIEVVTEMCKWDATMGDAAQRVDLSAFLETGLLHMPFYTHLNTLFYGGHHIAMKHRTCGTGEDQFTELFFHYYRPTYDNSRLQMGWFIVCKLLKLFMIRFQRIAVNTSIENSYEKDGLGLNECIGKFCAEASGEPVSKRPRTHRFLTQRELEDNCLRVLEAFAQRADEEDERDFDFVKSCLAD